MLTTGCSAVFTLVGVLLSVHGGGKPCCVALSPATTRRIGSALDRATLEGELPLAGKNKVHKSQF